MLDWNKLNDLTSLSHIDGRNGKKLSVLRPFFSEMAWMKIRLRVIVLYCMALYTFKEKTGVSPKEVLQFQSIYEKFTPDDARRIQTIEQTVNHDLKAIEEYTKQILTLKNMQKYIPYINLGIGSEDINSIALGIQLSAGRGEVLIPGITEIVRVLVSLTEQEKNTQMIARTHGQPAGVTTFGKECANTLLRLCDEMEIFRTLPLSAKCSGETGTFLTQSIVDTDRDWLSFVHTFIQGFDLVLSVSTTQIAPYDSVVRYFHSLFRINSILLDFSRNIWLYVLLGYMKVKPIKDEVGSAGMPHKVNPIHWEGAEGGLEMANGIIETLVRKLPINRLDRDFSDSTVRRNIILPLSLSLLSYQSIVEGMSRLALNREFLADDLSRHAEVWVEVIKTYGTIHGIGDTYDILKKATRGKILTQPDLFRITEGLALSRREKTELLGIIQNGKNTIVDNVIENVLAKTRKVFQL